MKALELADAYANACFDQALNGRTEDPIPEKKRDELAAELRRLAAVEAELEAMKIAASPAKWWKCSTHGPAKAGAWGCPECVSEMRAELERIKALPPVAWRSRVKGLHSWWVELQEPPERPNQETQPLIALGSKT